VQPPSSHRIVDIVKGSAVVCVCLLPFAALPAHTWCALNEQQCNGLPLPPLSHLSSHPRGTHPVLHTHKHTHVRVLLPAPHRSTTSLPIPCVVTSLCIHPSTIGGWASGGDWRVPDSCAMANAMMKRQPSVFASSTFFVVGVSPPPLRPSRRRTATAHPPPPRSTGDRCWVMRPI